MKFNDIEYFKINREERFYCFLICHASLSSELFRKSFLKLVEEKKNIILDPNVIEIYPEAAVLRDYWHNLGNPSKYRPETDNKRRSVIAKLLSKYAELPESAIDKNDFFKTSKGKLWSPAHWSEKSIKEAGFNKDQKNMLCKIKWAFNCKPDIMLFSNNNVVIFEAKVESRIGRDSRGYDQFDIQKFLKKLLKDFVPILEKNNFTNILIGNKSEQDNISWEEILSLMEKSDIDEFSKKSLKAAVIRKNI